LEGEIFGNFHVFMVKSAATFIFKNDQFGQKSDQVVKNGQKFVSKRHFVATKIDQKLTKNGHLVKKSGHLVIFFLKSDHAQMA